MSYLRTLLAGLAAAAEPTPLVRPADAVVGLPEPTDQVESTLPPPASPPARPARPAPPAPVEVRTDRPAERAAEQPPRSPAVVPVPAEHPPGPPDPAPPATVVVPALVPVLAPPLPVHEVIRERHTEHVVVREVAVPTPATPPAAVAPIQPLVRPAQLSRADRPEPPRPPAPRRAASPTPARASAPVELPTVEVRIGRVIVRTEGPPAAPPARPSGTAPPTPLADYLAARSDPR
ncbi:hypothetical protein [Geodermatophilus sp. SYSU D00710]